MSETDADELVRTPVREIPSRLIAKYTMDAFGVPDDPRPLKAILPRYLDLMASGNDPSGDGVGVGLLRFGEALASDATFYDDHETRVLRDWMHAFVARTAAMESRRVEGEPCDWAFLLAEVPAMLLCGGFAASDVTAALDAAFAEAATGERALLRFAAIVGDELVEGETGLGIDWFAMEYVARSAVVEFVRWLNRPWWRERLLRADAGVLEHEWEQESVATALEAFGRFDPALFPRDRWRSSELRP